MSTWTVLSTHDFEKEIKDIYNYIATQLLVPDIAAKQIKSIFDAVESLGEMPLGHSLYEKEPWRSRGLRKLPVDNYLVFYLTNQELKEVLILHIFYGGRNIDNLLH